MRTVLDPRLFFDHNSKKKKNVLTKQCKCLCSNTKRGGDNLKDGSLLLVSHLSILEIHINHPLMGFFLKIATHDRLEDMCFACRQTLLSFPI
jgi:hypothetical protein